jgi:glucokinase
MGHLLADLPVWLSADPHAGLRGAAAAFDNASLAPRVISAT